jgi:hypothetical protein
MGSAGFKRKSAVIIMNTAATALKARNAYTMGKIQLSIPLEPRKRFQAMAAAISPATVESTRLPEETSRRALQPGQLISFE